MKRAWQLCLAAAVLASPCWAEEQSVRRDGATITVSGGGCLVWPVLGTYYLSASSEWRLSERGTVSVGGLYASKFGQHPAAMVFGTTSLGSPEAYFSVGIGILARQEMKELLGPYGLYLGTEMRWRLVNTPIIMTGGTVRTSDRLAVSISAWLAPGTSLEYTPVAVTWRIGDRFPVSVGVVSIGALRGVGGLASFSCRFRLTRKRTE